jgi:putative membrane protein
MIKFATRFAFALVLGVGLAQNARADDPYGKPPKDSTDTSKAAKSGTETTKPTTDQDTTKTGKNVGLGTEKTTDMTPPIALEKVDQDFVMDVAKDSVFEIELGRLAQNKATNTDVKTFAETMVKDHTTASDELKGLAKGITLPTSLDKGQQKKLDGLRDEKDDFDRKYMKMMISAHKDAINLFEKESKKGKNTEIQAWANKMIPKLKEHLRMAEDTKRRLDQMSLR